MALFYERRIGFPSVMTETERIHIQSSVYVAVHPGEIYRVFYELSAVPAKRPLRKSLLMTVAPIALLTVLVSLFVYVIYMYIGRSVDLEYTLIVGTILAVLSVVILLGSPLAKPDYRAVIKKQYDPRVYPHLDLQKFDEVIEFEEVFEARAIRLDTPAWSALEEALIKSSKECEVGVVPALYALHGLLRCYDFDLDAKTVVDRYVNHVLKFEPTGEKLREAAEKAADELMPLVAAEIESRQYLRRADVSRELILAKVREADEAAARDSAEVYKLQEEFDRI